MKTDKSSVKGQLDIFEAMERAAAAVDRMVEEEQKHSRGKQVVRGTGTEEESSSETSEKSDAEGKKQADIIRGAAMHASLQKTFIQTVTDDFAMVAYIDYNMVYLKDWNAPAVLRRFSDSKEAVDYYMEQLRKISAMQDAKPSEENEPFSDVKYVMENVYAECE